ncbi:MAG TPA: DUF938 domain-containing protein [Myxococcaceae bacterium]|nr:DUF938 domain-containing protein [Myxococcaceae bacterium]
MTDRRRFAPATERNREPILGVLRQVLPPTGRVLEIASGTGEHAVFFAAALPELTFQPSDISEDALESIRAWIAVSGLSNVLPPVILDTSREPWPVQQADALLCSNMIHIAPWTAAEGLFRGAARILPVGAPLILYGPFQIGGRHTAPSNAAFDESLRQRNPQWGVRHLEDVESLAQGCGIALEARHQLPANNLALVFRRTG